MRFTIASVVIGIFLTTLSLAALKSPSRLLVDLHYSAVWLCLVLAAICCRDSPEPRKSFLLGFAIMGSAHQWLVHGVVFVHSFGPRLLTVDLIDSIMIISRDGFAAGQDYIRIMLQATDQYPWYNHVVPSMLSWLIALPGGWIALVSSKARRG